MNNILLLFLLSCLMLLGQTPDTNAEALSQVLEESRTLAGQIQKEKEKAGQFKVQATVEGSGPALQLPPPLGKTATLPDLMARLTEVNASLENSLKRITQATTGLNTSSTRISALSEQIAETRSQLSETPVPPQGSSDLEKARQEQAVLTKELLESRIESYRQEQVFLQRELEELPERLRLRKEYNSQLLVVKESLQTKIASLRRLEAQQTDILLTQSYQKLLGIPKLAAVVTEVKKLNERRTGPKGLQAQIRLAAGYEKRINRLSQRIAEQESSASEKIRLLESIGRGIDTDTGILLREQRAELPSTGELERRLRKKVELSVRTQVQLLDLQDKLSSHPPLTPEEVAELFKKNSKLDKKAIASLFTQRHSLLESSIQENRSLKTSLDASNAKARKTIARIERYSNFLDKRLLWSKSTSPIQLSEVQTEWGNIHSLFRNEKFTKARSSIQENWFSYFLPALLLATAFLFGVFRRGRLREFEKSGSEQAIRRNCTSIRPTVETVVSSALIAFTFPALFFLASLLISEPASFRAGCLNSGIFLFISSLVYRFSRPGMLFDSHFKFSPVKSERIHKTLRLFIPLLLPFVFCVGALCVNGGVGSSGRIVFIMTMLLVAGLAHQLFHPKHSIVGNPEKATILSRTSYALAMGLPLSFSIGAALGFFASVLTLRAQVLATAGVLLGAFLVIRFFTRWILVSRRKLAITQALQRREATLAEREREESGDHGSEPDVPSLEEVKAQAVDVVEVEEQTSQLLRFGVYFSVVFTIFSIWSSSLTALSILDQKRLWPNPQSVESQNSPADGLSILTSPGQVNPENAEGAANEQAGDPFTELVAAPSKDYVSWQDLLLSLFIFLITFVAARNVPGLLSLVVFSRLKLGPGGNFAFTTIVRYFIVLFGVVIALNKIGITWDKVQWLAAAITLGIGFGLQEIFANFVAGLILLFERPLRIGDIVTVGDASGKVTEIKIRATTIQQFNNRDLVVPNKDFITNQLTNWTLRDSILRLEVAVGIAYGSDTRQAEKILTQIVEAHPNILDDPGPQVIFNAFGASTLDFIIRAHVGQIGNLVSTQHDLHFQIDDAFRDAGIEIAFPQQDIHVRSLPESFSK